MKISAWYKEQLVQEKLNNRKRVLLSTMENLTKKQVSIALSLLLVIIFARSFYVISITNFYIFHLIKSYGLTIPQGQLYIFLFLALGAAGTLFGGPMADKMGRKNVIVLSLALPIPLCLLLPYVPLWAVILLLSFIGFIIMLSFSVTVVYAQELVPSKIGTMAGPSWTCIWNGRNWFGYYRYINGFNRYYQNDDCYLILTDYWTSWFSSTT